MAQGSDNQCSFFPVFTCFNQEILTFLPIFLLFFECEESSVFFHLVKDHPHPPKPHLCCCNCKSPVPTGFFFFGDLTRSPPPIAYASSPAKGPSQPPLHRPNRNKRNKKAQKYQARLIMGGSPPGTSARASFMGKKP